MLRILPLLKALEVQLLFPGRVDGRRARLSMNMYTTKVSARECKHEWEPLKTPGNNERLCMLDFGLVWKACAGFEPNSTHEMTPLNTRRPDTIKPAFAKQIFAEAMALPSAS